MNMVKISSCFSLSKDRGMQKATFHLFLNSVPLIYVTRYVLFYRQQKKIFSYESGLWDTCIMLDIVSNLFFL